jgi:glycopeptide antibiotics resistance protein
MNSAQMDARPLPRRYLLLYLVFIVYGSLVPFDFHAQTLESALAEFRAIRYLDLGVGSRADLIANFLLYLPLGWFAAGRGLWRRRHHLARATLILGIVALGVLLAVGVEFTQIFFKPRTVSQNDLYAESLGMLAGVLAWVYAQPLREHIQRLAHSGGAAALRALLLVYLLGYLTLSLFPFDFVISGAELDAKLGSDRQHWFMSTAGCTSALRCVAKLGAEVIAAIPIGILIGLRRHGPFALALPLVAGALLGIALEFTQVFLASGVSQGVSVLARMLGILGGAWLAARSDRAWLAQCLSARRRPWLMAALIAYPILGAGLTWSGKGGYAGLTSIEARLAAIHWMPFYYHYFTSESAALTNLLSSVTLYLPMGVSLALAWVRVAALPALMLGTLAALWIEGGKLLVARAHPDPTNLLVGAISVWLGVAFIRTLRNQLEVEPARRRRSHSGHMRHFPVWGAALSFSLLAALMIAIGALRLQVPIEHHVDESVLPVLPAAEFLPPVDLPGFRHDHPRLPAPSPDEIARIERDNPRWLKRHREAARRERGEFYSIILTARLEPGSVDLTALHRRLMALEASWRGHSQLEALALAYDWLHAQWSDTQSAALRNKLIETAQYVIRLIREEQRLSPYNVVLYNRPLQALMAATLAVYGDDPRADAPMRYLQDYWQQRVLPVWRQVMGQNGGWHEGGEYVGIGISEAVYLLPALWRNATGEDFFKSEPGIRGFLDFLLQRRRPDQTDFRWGDAAFFTRVGSGVLPLAIEARDAAAFSLKNCQKMDVAPSSWPWGPLPDPTLCDPVAIRHKPLTQLFDGIGLLVARSGWDPQATYVNFKAGDNYWSHSHEDQGAFTIYKGGALAIDSGLYGSSYGSDHHFNYTRQAIAHNTITVTDPADTVMMPGEKESRPIANDGGQRRIGSGWGIESAPLDLAEWQQKRDIYHTATLLKHWLDDDLAVAVADITPAYTNRYSGQGSFSHRTRRVERFVRSFIYDRANDAVVVHDRVVATRPAFVKRWLLHTQEAPVVTREGFSVLVSPQERIGHDGGRLEAHVLLPHNAVIQGIGGPGMEFMVDGVNYDEGGAIQKLAARKPGAEPGAWRVEIMPREESAGDVFLVVMLPTLSGKLPIHRVRLLQEGNRYGCEIVGPARITRWWFDSAHEGPLFETGIIRRDLRVASIKEKP